MELSAVRLEQKAELDEIFKNEVSRSADFCFGNIYMWDRRFEQSVCAAGGRLVTLLHRQGLEFFAFPVGSGSLAPAFDVMRAHCAEENIPLRLCGICEEHRALIESEFPGEFSFCEDRNFSDYLYDIDSLSSYSGKALHAKRNFCNRFEAEYKDSWRFVPLTKALLPDCLAMLDEWSAESLDRLGSGIEYEHDAIERGFSAFDELGLEGGVLFIGNDIIGFSAGEMLTTDCFCVHFEKAYPDIAGAYPMVCREMSRMLRKKHPDLRYVNREDDMGLESLRKSKLSYKPDEILTKYTAAPTGCILREYRVSDIPRLKELWRECFGDDGAVTDSFFRLLPDMGLGFVAECGGGVMGAAYLLGCSCGGKSFGYLYGVGVSAAARGRGLGEALSRLCAEKTENVCTLPAEDSLYAWYEEKLGVSPVLLCRHERVYADGGEPRFNRLSPYEYMTAREKLLDGETHFEFSEAWYKFQRVICRAYGGDFFGSSDGIVCGYIDGDALLLKEALGDVSFVPSLCATLNVKYADIRRSSPTGAPYISAKEDFPKDAVFNLSLD